MHVLMIFMTLDDYITDLNTTVDEALDQGEYPELVLAM